MISRRQILSKSSDNLSFHNNDNYTIEDEEDVWYSKDKLYKDHIQEVLDKWTQIDDEIWAKVIVLEKNRRVAKAYARAPVLTINGFDDGFDGLKLGLCGFDNPLRDGKTEEVKRHIGHGVKLKMDDQGNILIKRISKSNVFVRSIGDEEDNAGTENFKLMNCALEIEKPSKLFDMKKFQLNVSSELQRVYPDRRRLECQCLSAIAFVKSEENLLDCPIWVLLINIVAMDMLKSKLPPVKPIVDIKNRPRIPIPDEDPYSIAGSGTNSYMTSGNSSCANRNGNILTASREPLFSPHRNQDKPPKLPPRDTRLHVNNIPKSNYDGIHEDNEKLFKDRGHFPITQGFGHKFFKDKKCNNHSDDPYYCGMKARVPNFAKTKMKENKILLPSSNHQYLNSISNSHMTSFYTPQYNSVWNARSYDSGINTEFLNSPYKHIYGKLPIPTRGYIPSASRSMHFSDWD